MYQGRLANKLNYTSKVHSKKCRQNMKKTSYKNFFFSFILFLFSLGTAAIAIFLNWIAYNIGAENYFFSVFFAICGIFLLSIAGLLGYAIKNPETLSEADTDDSSLLFLTLFNIICAIGSINITNQHSPF